MTTQGQQKQKQEKEEQQGSFSMKKTTTSTTQFPNLFVETVRSTTASIMIFAVADLRRIAREEDAAAAQEEEEDDNNNKKKKDQYSTNTSTLVMGNRHVLELPMRGPEMIQFTRDNRDVLKAKVRSNEYQTVDYLLRQATEEDSPGGVGGGIFEIDNVVIQHFGDDNALHECVHAIVTNSATKSITLAFRGSITMQDWITDAKLMSGDIANPLYNKKNDDKKENEKDDNKRNNNDGQPQYLGVHLGFRDYLYDVHDPLLPSLRELQKAISKAELQKVISKAIPSNQDSSDKGSSNNDKDGSSSNREVSSNKEHDASSSNRGESFAADEQPKRNKIDVILDQVQELLDENPDYKLYITGHSLGGALALLTSVEAAVRFATPGIPVTCVAIANPRVGDNRFRAAIQALEHDKKLRCLTVHNLLDLVPSMPSRFCRCDFCRPNKFCMPGMQLVLTDHSFTTIYHSETNDTRWDELRREFQRFLRVVFCCFQMARQHDYRTYLDRLVEQKDALSKLYLNDLYKEQGIDFDSSQ